MRFKDCLPSLWFSGAFYFSEILLKNFRSICDDFHVLCLCQWLRKWKDSEGPTHLKEIDTHPSQTIDFSLPADYQEFGRNHNCLAQEMAHVRPLSFIPRKNCKWEIIKRWLSWLSFVTGRIKIDSRYGFCPQLWAWTWVKAGKRWKIIDVCLSSERPSYWKGSFCSCTVAKGHMLW